MKVVGPNQLEYTATHFNVVRWDSTFPYTATMINKDIHLDYDKIQDVFMVINYSSNRFEGEISKLMGSLKGFHSLNISNN
jgi:hypothetical protein